MKKLLAALLSAALLATTAVGCGSNGNGTDTSGNTGAGDSSGTKQVHFANWWGEHEIEIADKYFKEKWTPESGIEVVFDYIPFDGFVQKMVSEITAGNPADLILCNSDMVSSYAKNGLMLELDEYMERDSVDFSEFYGSPDWVVNGKMVGLPSWYGAWFMYVNTTMLEENGIDVPRGSWTWDEMREICLKVADPGNGIYGLSDGMSNEPIYWYMLNGGAAFSDDMSECTINSPEVVDTMEFVRKLIYEDKVVPEPSSYSTTPADQLFRDGKAAFHYNGTWTVNYLRTNADSIDFNWDVIFAPTGPNAKGDVTPARSSGMFIPKNGKDVETSWEVMKHWGSEEGINNIDIGALSSMPSSAATLEDEAYYTYPDQQPESFNKDFLGAVASRAKYFPFTHHILGTNVQNAMNSLSNVWVENKDSKTVCDEAYETIMANWDAIEKVG